MKEMRHEERDRQYAFRHKGDHYSLTVGDGELSCRRIKEYDLEGYSDLGNLTRIEISSSSLRPFLDKLGSDEQVLESVILDYIGSAGKHLVGTDADSINELRRSKNMDEKLSFILLYDFLISNNYLIQEQVSTKIDAAEKIEQLAVRAREVREILAKSSQK